MQLINDKIAVFGTAEEGALKQIEVCAKTAHKAALMPDNHKGYGVPIGGVVAYKDAISPTGVGYDIGCGNKAVLTDMQGEELRKNIVKIMDDVWSTISFGVGQKNNERVDHPLFDNFNWYMKALAPLKELARVQLGTVGSGNHFVDLFTDEQDRVWVGVHFGSRGFGHKIATFFLQAAGGKDGMDVDPVVLPVDEDLGNDYLDAMALAGEYAYAGRNWVCDRVAKLLGATVLSEVHNHHNFAWLEEHDGEKLWVVRKGATPAFPGQRGFIGGSMGEQSVIIEGVETELAKYSLYSTVHGAGRVMGRREATGVVKYNKETGERRVVREGKITQDMMDKWLTDSKVELRGGGLDESPDCYKRLPEVLAATEGTIKILHTLTPVGVAMAGKFEHDPYKD